MTNKIYYLSTCSTCQRIMKELGIDENFEQQDIKIENISEPDLEMFAKQAGSYEALFSKRAMKYKSMGLKEKNLSEDDYKQLMLDEYTFLKRPFILIDGEAFIGNSKKTVEAAKAKLGL
ncbi:arsenate reductase [Ancylomarina subtilis]|uniref:Arsenate reductase n=1 Tax=Ancylomarina subtilis TaxID=1639035 RepID=A0A4Q7VIB1_9BACT|nr:ArsC/Spx/MgsR family protein [Ancylomarina subtilis]RZT95862.1 arsenate reductase [Ancylomarina subtilis]